MKPKVYFTRDITPENVVRLYHLLGVELPGKVAVKVHSGEQGNQNYLTPEFWKPMVDEVGGTIVECNTAYGDASGGVRDHTETHWELMEEHGWTTYFDVDIMDAEGPDVVWPVRGGKQLTENHLGKHIEDYDSMLVLARVRARGVLAGAHCTGPVPRSRRAHVDTSSRPRSRRGGYNEGVPQQRRLLMAITVNLYYAGENGAARAFAEEMEASGTAAAIRAEAGNVRYRYFQPLDDPETVLLIDAWEDQAAIDAHHASPMMAKVAELRDKYDLHMTAERYVADEDGFSAHDQSFIRS